MEAGEAPARAARWRPALLLVPALVLALSVIILESADVYTAREWPAGVAVFNALFCAAPAIIIAVLAARDHLASGSFALLLLGPAALVFGLAYLAQALVGPSSNLGITVHNVGVLVASILFLASAVSSLLVRDGSQGIVDRTAALMFSYLGTLAAVAIVMLLSAGGFLPAFRIGSRVTVVREITLVVAALLLIASSVCFAYLYGRRRDRFLLMCGAALAVIAVSLGVLALTRAPAGSAIVWIGRAGQWVGGVYLLVAVFTLAERRIVPLRDLRELQERHRTLVELSPDPIIVDADGRYLFANPAAARLLGLSSPDDLVGRSIVEFVASENLGTVDQRRARAIEGHPNVPQQIRLIRADGTPVYVETMDRRVMFGGRLAALVIMRDITQRKQVEAALRASEERHRQLAQENEQLYRRQLEIAESLQTALLNLPSSIGRLTLGHRYHSATESARVGGDFYDVFEIKDDQIAVVIGDVAGHGIEAARTATLVKDVVHAFAHQSPRSREVLRRTNKVLVEKEVPGFFVTLFLAILNGRTGEFHYTSAGHPSALIRRASGKVVSLDSGTPPLGIYPEATWKASEALLQPGDILLMYTDGLTEARRDGEFFGEDRLKALLGQSGMPPGELPDHLLEQVLLFSKGVLKDDVAVLALSLAARP